MNSHLGYVALGLLVGVESAGVPVPGETALIAAGFLAHRGTLNIEVVILVAATAAILGDNVGYLFGRRGGRALLTKPGPLLRHRLKVLEHGEPFFAKHGAKAVFFGRWVTTLRIAAAWLAGATHMPWSTFLFWNTLGGVAWATTVGLAAFYLGDTAERIFKTVGFAGLGAFLLGLVVIVLLRRRRRPSRG